MLMIQSLLMIAMACAVLSVTCFAIAGTAALEHKWRRALASAVIGALLLFTGVHAAFAANTKLSSLSAGAAASDTDLIYDVQSAGSGGVKETLSQMWTWIQTHLASPGPIGGTTPDAGSFTTVSATGNLTSNITGGGTQCVQASNAGVLSGTSSGCGAGGGAASTPAVYVTNQWYEPLVFNQSAASGAAQSTNIAYCFFGSVSPSVTIKTLGANISAGGNNANALQMAIYSLSGTTLTLVDSTVNIAQPTTSGIVSGALNNTTDTLNAGTVYAFCENNNNAITLAAFGASNIDMNQIIGTTTFDTTHILQPATTYRGVSFSMTFNTTPATTWGSPGATLAMSTATFVSAAIIQRIAFQVN